MLLFKKIHIDLNIFTLLFLIMFYSNSLSAQGVIAGTNITNTAVVSYVVDGEIQGLIESSPTGNSASGIGNGQETAFKVDRKIDLLVTSNGDTNVAPGDHQAELTFLLTNEGNDTQEFMLIADSRLIADDFDSNNCISTVLGVTGTPLPNVVLPTSGSIKLKVDQQASISVKCDIPLLNNGQEIVSGKVSTLSLFAVAEKNSDGSVVSETTGLESASLIDTVFADDAGTDDLRRDASHSSRGRYITSDLAALPTLKIDKTIIEVDDQKGGNKMISGAEVKYKIKVLTQGTGVIDNLVVTDKTPEGMIYKRKSIRLDNNNLTDGVDGDSGDYGVTSANTVTLNLGDIVAGTQHEIYVTYIVN